jgi:hypothetical protein
MTDVLSLSSDGEGTKTSSGSFKGGTHGGSTSEKIVLGQKESNLIWHSRIVVFLVLLVTTVGVSVLTFKFTEREEEKDFETRVSTSSSTTSGVY